MQREPAVDSRFVRSFGYDVYHRILEVEHVNKTIWHFYEVDLSIHQGLQRFNYPGEYHPKPFDKHFQERVLDAGIVHKQVS